MIKSHFIAPDEYAKIEQIQWMETDRTFNFHIFTMNTTQINETHRPLWPHNLPLYGQRCFTKQKQ